ncbi:hypothetical protein, partial [Streptococcus pneumoniae]|uniref:hypothetical protein n=1 Tax=Streptococcus pneumoniae TaxID=1313 RepID=UPI0018B03FFA
MDSTAAFNLATGESVIIPPGAYRCDILPTNPVSAIIFGATFTGAGAFDSPYPTFGGALKVITKGSRNA